MFVGGTQILQALKIANSFRVIISMLYPNETPKTSKFQQMACRFLESQSRNVSRTWNEITSIFVPLPRYNIMSQKLVRQKPPKKSPLDAVKWKTIRSRGRRGGEQGQQRAETRPVSVSHAPKDRDARTQKNARAQKTSLSRGENRNKGQEDVFISHL